MRNMICPTCSSILIEVIEDYSFPYGVGNEKITLIAEDISFLRCTKCEWKFLDSVSEEKIEIFIDECRKAGKIK
jgi:C4-type Zn-finger protein